MLGRFKWGHTFPEVNSDLLKRYGGCKNSGEVVQLQQDYLEEIKQQDQEERQKYHGMFPLKDQNFYSINIGLDKDIL